MPLPDLSEVLCGFGDPVVMIVIGQGIEDHELIETQKPGRTFDGVLVPVDAEKLKVGKAGERSWRNYTLYAWEMLATDDIVQDPAGKKYRVMDRRNWASFYEYNVTEMPYP